MTWKDHISYISNKLAKSISVLYRVKWTLDSRALRQLYYTLVLPCISCCTIIWGNTYHTNVLPIFAEQEKAIRIISNAKYNDHTSKLFHNLSNLAIFQLVKSQTCIVMHGAFRCKLPHTIQSYFTKTFSGNEHRTRRKDVSNKYILEQLKESIVYLILGTKCGIT